MPSALLETPATEEQLREQAERLASAIEARLPPAPPPDAGDRHVFFGELRAAIVAVARSPAWRAHDLARELLLLLEDLRDAIDADPEAADPQWRQREVLQRFVAERLADVEVGAVARLLATTPRMVSQYRRGEVGQIRRNPNRVTLVGQLVSELQYSMTPRGVLLWFDAPMAALRGRTPRELLDRDPVANRGPLMSLARGGRAQLDAGGVA